MIAGRDCWRLLLKITEADKETEKATAGLVVKDISIDAAVAVISTELYDIFTVKEEQITAPKALLSWKDVFILLLAGFGKSLVEHQWHIVTRYGAVMPLAPIGGLKLLLTELTGSKNLIGPLWMW